MSFLFTPMIFSQAYTDMLQHANKRCLTDGQRSFPSPSMEIYLLQQAQQKAKRKESTIFDQLVDIFDWDITRKQRKAYIQALGLGFTLVITDLSKTILWASHSFLSMTGYTTTEAVGQTPIFLQGEQTSRADIIRIREQLRRATSVKADLINYRKSGEPYICRIEIDPLRNSQGELTHFLAVESEMS